MIRLKQRLQNEAGETYFVLLSADSDEEAATFLQDMWRYVDMSMYPTPDQALGEWTDRFRRVRSSYSNYGGICIRTHAWSPSDDEQPLYGRVLVFLRTRGIDV